MPVVETSFYLYPETFECWQVANELRGDFAPATVIAFLSMIVKKKHFRTRYNAFMTFASAALAARKTQDK